VSAAPLTAWHNYAGSLLERTLDDSANRRTLFPETFLALDEILATMQKIVSGLRVNETAIKVNLAKFGPFAATERLLMAAVKNGADRQETHEVLRQLSMAAWEAIQEAKANPLVELACANERLARWLKPQEIRALFSVEGYTGIAASRARELAELIISKLK
jgi:adenylosuccinate lyase